MRDAFSSSSFFCCLASFSAWIFALRFSSSALRFFSLAARSRASSSARSLFFLNASSTFFWQASSETAPEKKSVFRRRKPKNESSSGSIPPMPCAMFMYIPSKRSSSMVSFCVATCYGENRERARAR